MKYIVSVSKTYKHRGNRIHRASTKKYWHVYYYEYDDFEEKLNLKSKQINPILVPYYKVKKVYKRVFYCFECDTKFWTLVKKNQKEIDCPYCSVN